MSKRKSSSNNQASPARSGVFSPGALSLRLLAGAAIIVLAVFFAYLPSINGGFILDDDALLTKNALIGSPDGLRQFWCTAKAEDYWPVTNSSLWIEWRLWGMKPTGYHVTNLTLHIIEAILIWILLRKLSIPGAFLAAIIFAVHPVNVESVAWISQRKNMMAMLFFLLSILWYLRFDGLARRPTFGRCPLAAKQSTAHCPPSTSHYFPWYWLSLAAFVLAMLSKGSVVVLPVLLLGIIWWLRPLTSRDLIRTAPFLLLAVALTGVNIWFQTHGKAIEFRDAGFLERLLGAGGVLWFYLYKALLPLDLVFVYPQWHIEAGNPMWWLPLFAALAVTAVFWRYRASWSRPFLFAWGFFCVALGPVMGFKDVGFMKYSLVADHYQHIAIIGLIALVSAGWIAWRSLTRGKAGWAATAVAIATAAALIGLTWRQNMLYSGEITLYQATLEKNQNCWLAHNNLGIALVEAGNPRDAFDHYRQALLLRPGFHETLYNMGNAYRITSKNEQAIECYRQALEQKPDFIEAHINLGITLVQAGRPNEAIQHYQKTLGINADQPDAELYLGNAFKELGQNQQAIEHYRQALFLKPDYIEAQNDLGALLAQTGQVSEAMEHYLQALAIDPNSSETHYNLGNALYQSGRTKEAIDHYQIALALKPDYFEAHNNLGAALIKAGRPQEAIIHYKQGLRLKPNDASVYMNLAVTYANMKQSSEAIAAAQRGIELARSLGQTEMARQIENWLNSYRAGMSNPPDKPPSQTTSPP
jgi:protein O-mannosyl-transferase